MNARLYTISLSAALLLSTVSTQAYAAGRGDTGRQLSGSLPPLATALAPGHKFTEASLPVVPAANRWIRIPAWLAGSWETRNDMVVYSLSHASGKETFTPKVTGHVIRGTWGQQKDRHGDTWDLMQPAGTRDERSEKVRDVYYEGPQEAFVAGPDTVRTHRRDIVLRIDQRSGRILKTTQQEKLGSFRTIADGLMEIAMASREFDALGKPVRTTYTVYVAKRTAPFSVIDQLGSKNYAHLFRDYLKSQGRTDLVP